MIVDKLEEGALLPNPEARAYLSRELLASLDELDGVEIEKLWVEQAIRRDEELDNETARAYPADEVFARPRARRK